MDFWIIIEEHSGKLQKSKQANLGKTRAKISNFLFSEFRGIYPSSFEFSREMSLTLNPRSVFTFLYFPRV